MKLIELTEQQLIESIADVNKIINIQFDERT